MIGLNLFNDIAEVEAKKTEKQKRREKPNTQKIKPPKPFKEMTMEEHMAWMNQAGRGKM